MTTSKAHPKYRGNDIMCVFVCRGVRDASRSAGAGRGCDAGVPLPSPLLSVGSRPKGGHAGGRSPHPGEAGRQEDPPRLPANDHQAGQRHHRHQQLEGRKVGRVLRECMDAVNKNLPEMQKHRRNRNPHRDHPVSGVLVCSCWTNWLKLSRFVSNWKHFVYGLSALIRKFTFLLLWIITRIKEAHLRSWIPSWDCCSATVLPQRGAITSS